MILVPLLLIFGGYLAFSILLFFFPTILHSYTFQKLLLFRQALSGKRVLRIAHRGGCMVGPQNTMQTFRINAGISDMLQMDVCQTKDGLLVVHHDHDLQRTCGVKGKIKDFNYADLPPFKKRIQLNFASDGRTVETNGQKMPLLQEVFKEFPDIPMNIQLKTPSERAVKEFSRLIKQYSRNDKTIVGIRGKEQNELRQLDINGLRFMNDSQFKQILLYLITGLLPFIYIEETSLQLPLFTQQAYEWKIQEWGNTWKVRFGLKAIGVMNTLLRPLVEHLRRRGIMTYYWVCNSEQSFKRAITCGACGIMTDNPPLLQSYLQSVNLSQQLPQLEPKDEDKKQK